MKKVIYLALAVVLTATFSLADMYSENPEKDTWVWPGNGPYGSSNELRTNNPSYDQWIVIQFDLSSIPDGSTVNYADLYCYRYEGWYSGDTNCDLYRVTEEWDEYTLVDTIAHDDTYSYDNVNVGTPNGWKVFDVTELVQEWLDGTYDNYGLVFYGTSGSGYYQRICSREYGSNEPYLEVDYDVVMPGPFALLTPADGEIIDVFSGRGGDTGFVAETTTAKNAGMVMLYNRTEDPVDVDVEFTWEESTLAEEYELIIDDDYTFNTPEYDIPGITDEAYTNTFSVDHSIIYYWRVIASNEYGEAQSNEDFSFEFNYNNTNVAPASLGEVKATFR
ncbi:MAG: DNRLRE domain-containing protein [Candidatus Coatesbacteria bacterium]|nr:MAG: DNRLRE domain-containing protein [Candidatus Coatesbacteria bacterium]